jgi:hypothetical protein
VGPTGTGPCCLTSGWCGRVKRLRDLFRPVHAPHSRDVRGRKLRAIVGSLTVSLGAACGHMAPYSETPLGYVELYEGIQHRYQLRIPYKVQVYDPFPSRSYVDSRWLSLDGSGTEVLDTRDSGCPEGTETFGSGYATRGKITFVDDTATVELEQSVSTCRNPVDGRWCPFKFNGKYRLVPPASSAVAIGLSEGAGDCRLPKR